VPLSTSAKISTISLSSSRFTTKPVVSLTSTAFFFSVFASANAGSQLLLVGRPTTDDLNQRQNRDRIEEVKADDPLGMIKIC
jgi:hypothetical protein